MKPRILFAILAHDHPASLRELAVNVRAFCPSAQLVLYNSGTNRDLARGMDIEEVPSPSRLLYSHVTGFFFDVFDWLEESKRRYDYWINLETDMLFIRSGFEGWIASAMRGCHYMAPLFGRRTAKTSRWRPIRTLRPELPKWYHLLDIDYTNRGFSPGQVFSRDYVKRLLGDPRYPEIRRLVAENQSNTLQEVLFPTLPDCLGLTPRSYPEELTPINRYRPYQAVSGVKRALSTPSAYFIHPVRRNMDDPARSYVRGLARDHEARSKQ